MRFDDRLNTALMQPMDTETRANTQWVQLVDLLSQPIDNLNIDDLVDGLQRLRYLMDIVPEKIRVSGVQSIMGRLYSPPLLQLLVGDTAVIALCAIRAAKFSDEQWAALIPTLPARARGYLRNREDLGPKSTKALSIWASADNILPAYNDTSNVSKPDNGIDNEIDDNIYLLQDRYPPEQQNRKLDNVKQDSDNVKVGDVPINDSRRQRIDEIVEKIEQLRNSRDQHDVLQLPLEGGADGEVSKLTEIYFATDEQGTINWVDGAPRAAMVGISIAEPSYDNAPGPDASGAAGFKQRIPLENARMRLCGPDIIDGNWRMNAVPFFTYQDGRFKGYKGLFRRPNLFESAGNSDYEKATFSGKSSDNLQQLIHELRTPLGAVIGFAEIIEQQLFGPASTEYRMLAKTILEEGNRLLSGFDDLNVAAKIDAGVFQASLGVTDCNWMLTNVLRKLEPLIENQSIEFSYVKAENIDPLAVNNEDAERIFMRLLSALIVNSCANEVIVARWQKVGTKRVINQFSVKLPHAIKNKNEMLLLESGPNIEEDNVNAPLLGLGFSLRLVRNLANNVGGNLLFQKEQVILNLPASRNNIMRENEQTND